MSNMQILSEEMEKLRQQIVTLHSLSGYENEDDNKEKEWMHKKSADDRQKIEEYSTILYMLASIRAGLDYLRLPIKEEGILHLNEDGRYEADNGYCYTCGSTIEFLRVENIFNHQIRIDEKVEIWSTGRVEYNGQDYYIVGYPGVELQGLKVRIR